MMERFRIMAEQVPRPPPPTLPPTHTHTYTHTLHSIHVTELHTFNAYGISTYPLTHPLNLPSQPTHQQERRAKSKFQSMYKILETVFPLVIPDEPEPTKAAEIETGEGDLAAASGGGGMATPGATPKAGGMTGTMRSELEMNDADAALPRLGSFGNFGNLLSTPKGGPLEKRGSRSSAADHNSRASFQGYLHPATPKPSTAQKSRALAIKKAKKARSFSERDSRLQRLESLYAGYLEER